MREKRGLSTARAVFLRSSAHSWLSRLRVGQIHRHFILLQRERRIAGRGKQRGIKIGEITYDEIPKTMLMCVIRPEDEEFVINTIMNTARTGSKGAFGDGKIFISDVECAYTISSGVKEGAEVAA